MYAADLELKFQELIEKEKADAQRISENKIADASSRVEGEREREREKEREREREREREKDRESALSSVAVAENDTREALSALCAGYVCVCLARGIVCVCECVFICVFAENDTREALSALCAGYVFVCVCVCVCVFRGGQCSCRVCVV